MTDGERVYALFGGLGLFALNARSGKLALVEAAGAAQDAQRLGLCGLARAPPGPLVLRQRQRRALGASRPRRPDRGRELWRIDRDEKTNWATPFVWQSGKRVELVTCGTGAVRSYDLNGKPLWTLRGMSSIAIPTPGGGRGATVRELRLRRRLAPSALRHPPRAGAETSRGSASLSPGLFRRRGRTTRRPCSTRAGSTSCTIGAW